MLVTPRGERLKNFQFLVESDPEFHWFYFAALRDLSRKLTLPS